MNRRPEIFVFDEFLNNNVEVKEMKNPLVIYHANCADGFSAAWCFYNFDCMQEAQEEHMILDQGLVPDPNRQRLSFEFHPGVYGEEPPDCTDRNVYLVDFSYKREVVERIVEVANHVYLIDHHKTAIEDLAPLFEHPKFTAYIDLERSGAMLAWDFLHNTVFSGPVVYHTFRAAHDYKEPPLLLEHVQDRDLWKFKLEGTRPIQAAMFSQEYTFENWDRMMLGVNRDKSSATMEKFDLWKQGEAIERKHFKDIKELVKVCARRMLIGNVWMPVASLPYTMASDAGHIMASEPVIPGHAPNGVAACYYDTADHRVFSLRSIDNGPDVSEIAKNFGGGGHKHAAGFKVKRSHWLAQD